MWSSPGFCWQGVKTYLVFSTLISRPTTLITSNRLHSLAETHSAQCKTYYLHILLKSATVSENQHLKMLCKKEINIWKTWKLWRWINVLKLWRWSEHFRDLLHLHHQGQYCELPHVTDKYTSLSNRSLILFMYCTAARSPTTQSEIFSNVLNSHQNLCEKV